MSLIPRIYQSTDVGAPAVSGTAGSLVTLLDAILVDGYGTGPDLKPGAGWTRAFTASGKRVFRNNPVTGTGYYLRVDDTASLGNARHALVVGYESMSDIDTGVNPFPTAAQLTNGSPWVKSTVLSAAARAWWALATEKWVYLHIDTGGNGIARGAPTFAGDFISARPGDANNFAIAGLDSATYTGSGKVSGLFVYGNLYNGTVTGSFVFIARPYSGVGGSVTADIPRNALGFSNSLGSAGFTYPDVVSGGLIMEDLVLREGPMLVRGRLPNVFAPLHNLPFADMQSLAALDGFPGTNFVAKRFASITPTTDGQVIYDVTSEA